MKMAPQQYCLRWKHHHSNVQNMFAQLLEKERFCDVTLYCSPSFSTQVPNKDTVEADNIKGVSLRAHRVVLAACSELLGTLLGAHESLGEPVLVIDGAEPKHLRALLDYMYTGEMSVHHSQLASLLKTAEELRIKGLTDIRWNNKDEPPDCQAGGVITTSSGKRTPDGKAELDRQSASPKPRADRADVREKAPVDPVSLQGVISPELRAFMNREEEDRYEKYSVNGGPPPLIKLPPKDKSSPIKREHSDTDTQSPKRQRLGSENTDDDSQSIKAEREEWQHGNMDISAERVVGWGSMTSPRRSESDDDWGDAPADIGSFLHTRLRVPGDNSADEESNDSFPAPPASLPSLPTSAITSSSSTPPLPSAGISPADLKVDLLHAPLLNKPGATKSSGPTDPRFADVVKLHDYLQHGRRPQFWEENYVRRVMEAVRLKELEMKQAAEILGVSYGTLYGRYRDVYGCINRPYSGQKFIFDRTARDFWQAKGPSEVVERLQRGELTVEAASQALGVAAGSLAAYVADVPPATDFEPIPIEIDPSLKLKPQRPPYPAAGQTPPLQKTRFKPAPASPADKSTRKVTVGSLEDDDPIPATVITTNTTTSSGKWPSLRVAQLDTLRAPPATAVSSPPADPSLLMKNRPDLTIVAARRDRDGNTPPA